MIEIRKILLPLDTMINSETALLTGIQLAQRFQAHLAVLHVYPDSQDMAPLAGEGFPNIMIDDLLAEAEKSNERQSLLIAKMFRDVMARNDIAVSPPTAARAPTTNFIALTGLSYKIATYQARLADMVLVPHPAQEDGYASSETLHAILFDGHGPVLIAPREPPGVLGQNIAIAWNGTPQAASALHHALPWARTAQAVHIFHAPNQYQQLGPDAQDAIDFLSLHGIEARLYEFSSSAHNPGQGLLRTCQEFGIDLLCMGAYSRSRLRQLIMGGVTRYMLENADLPIMMCR